MRATPTVSPPAGAYVNRRTHAIKSSIHARPGRASWASSCPLAGRPAGPCGTFAAVRRSKIHALTARAAFGTALLASAVAISACGSGEQQDANETSGTFKVDLAAAFPKKQSLAENQTFSLKVTNRSSETIPNVTATVDGFYDRSTQEGEQDPRQAVWIVNRPPVGGVTALTNTYALGPLPAGGEKVFTWNVTPMEAGKHTVRYRVDASLYGKSEAVLADSGEPPKAPKGHISVAIDGNASLTAVDPKTGEVVVTGQVPRTGEDDN